MLQSITYCGNCAKAWPGYQNLVEKDGVNYPCCSRECAIELFRKFAMETTIELDATFGEPKQ